MDRQKQRDEPMHRNPSPWWLLAFALPLGGLTAAIATSVFLCDDAFISFRYARNLLDGHGLVFNRGEFVEGYTNLLWVLEIAGLWRVGLRPEYGAHVLSLAATVLTLLVLLRGARRLVSRGDRMFVAWIGIGLVACCPSFAIWSTSGLETRQFTLLIVGGAFVLLVAPTSPKRCVVASMLFAMAELTRPEGLLLFCCAWLWLAIVSRSRRAGAGPLLAFSIPFALVAAGHFLWRYDYYGELLPNTYYAKHVRAWYESGFDYLAAAGLEQGAWLWLPLAAIAIVARASRFDFTWLLPVLLTLPHALYLLTIGGDHFEYRPLDFYLPLFALPAAEGLLLVGRGAVGLLPAGPRLQHAALVALTLLLWLYSHAFGVASRLASLEYRSRNEVMQLRITLDERNAAWALALPGGRPIASILNHLRERLPQAVAAPAQQHIVFSRAGRRDYAAYEQLPRGVIPNGAVMAFGTVGILPFYLPDLTIIDILGLTDRTVARNPVRHHNDERTMAHDRRPPPGYLQERGVNLYVHPAVSTMAEALAAADFALEVTPDTWMPIRTYDREYVQREFPADRLAWRNRTDAAVADHNRVLLDGSELVGTRLLSTFERPDEPLSWEFSGDARLMARSTSKLGALGERFASTQSPDVDRPSAAVSASFSASTDAVLVLFVAGKSGLGQRLHLVAGDRAVATLIPPAGLPAVLTPVQLDLAPWAGQPLHLELHDGGPGWMAIDHVMLATSHQTALGRRSLSWSTEPNAIDQGPLTQVVRIAPLQSDGDLARSGVTSIQISNPTREPIEVNATLASAPCRAVVRLGPWRADGRTIPHIPPGGTARAQLELQVSEPTRCDLEPFLLRLSVQGLSVQGISAEGSTTQDPAANEALEAELQIPLQWQVR